MSYQRGTNAGLSGTISIPGVGALFEVQIFKWSPRLAGTPKPRRGRGGGVYRTFRWMMSSGTGACSGKPNLDGWPSPDAWKGQTGTLTVQVHTSKTVAYPVLITEMGFKYDEKTQDLPDVSFTWEITGAPTYTGWGSGSQPGATDPSKADQIQWEGSSKTYDPSGLQDSAIVLIDIWGTLSDSDSAETTKLVAVVAAAAAPMTGQQNRTATYTRDALDGGTITLNTGLNTTKQDLEFEASGILDDPTDLEDGTEIALVQSSATPSAPGTPSGLKVVGPTATKQLTPGRWLHTFRYGRRDNKDAIEQEGTYVDLDVSNLTSAGRQTTVYTTASGEPGDPTPPNADLQIVSSRVTVRNNVKSVKTWIFELDTPQQKAEQARSYTDTDPQGLTTKAAAAQLDGTPATPAGLVLRNTKVENLTHELTITTKEAGVRTTADDETYPRTRVSTDASAIEQEDSIAVVFTTGGSPSAPTRAGMVVADYFDVPLTNAGASNLSVRVYRMSYATNSQKLTLPRFNNAVDPNDLDTEKRSAVLFDSGSPPGDPGLPSGLKLVSKTDVGIASHPTKQVRIYLWAKNDSFDKIIHGHTVSQTRSFEGTTADTVILLDSSNTAALIATAEFATYKADATWEGATVRKLHDHLAEIIRHTRDQEIIVAGRSSSARRVIAPAYLDGSDIWVFMRRKRKIGSNLWDYELAEQYIWGEKIEFTISRHVSGSTLPYHSDLLNTTNGAAFLGLAAGFVTYLGVAESLSNIAVATPRVSSMTWCFEYDSLGIIDLADASPGWNWTTSDLTSVGPGWVKASDLGLSSSALGTGDYSVFTA